MIVIIGLAVLLIAVIVGIVGVLGNAGVDHSLTGNFSMFGYTVTGSTGTLFLVGIVVGAVAMLGMSAVLAGSRHTAARGQQARRELARSQREAAFANRDRATLLEQQSAGADVGPSGNSGRDTAPGHGQTNRTGVRRSGLWSRLPKRVTSGQRDDVSR